MRTRWWISGPRTLPPTIWKGGDYVFMNHTHADHIANLQEVCDRFHPTVIAHSAVCMELARQFFLPLTSLYPVDYDCRRSRQKGLPSA